RAPPRLCEEHLRRSNDGEGFNMLTLYLAPGSSSMAVHIALHEIGVPFETKPMSFSGNDMRAPNYLKLNPEGKVPTLLIGGRPPPPTPAALFFLSKHFP